MNFRQSWRTFVQALRLSYDHLGKLVLISALWFALGFGPLLLIPYLPVQSPALWLMAIAVSFLAFGGGFPAVHYIVRQAMNRGDVSARDFWSGFKKFFVRGSVLFFLRLLGFFILAFNIFVGLNNPNTLFLILSGFWLWGFFYWYAVQQFVFPFLVQQDTSVLAALKKSVLITLDNPLASLVLLLVSLIIGIASVVLAIPLLIFTAGFLAFLQNCFYNGMMLKYGGDEDPGEEHETK